MMTNDEGNDQSHTYSRDWLVDDVYHTTRSKPKSDVILLKINSGGAWFADASVNGTSFKFLMDTGTSKSVMSSKRFMFIPERDIIFHGCRSCNYINVLLQI